MTSDTTIIELFVRRVAADGPLPALHIKRGGEFQPVTWQEFAGDVRHLASVLIQLGVQPGDRVIQLSENRYEWLVSDLAIQFAQAVHVPVHAPLTGPQAAFQIKDSGARVVLVSTGDQAAKLASCPGKLPDGIAYLSYDPFDAKIGACPVRPLRELLDEVRAPASGELEQHALANITPDSLATILYTSGTTGEPKGVMLSQRNLTSNTLAMIETFEQQPGDLRLTFLPLSHIFARTCDFYTWVAGGGQLALAESRDTVLADAAALRPTVLNGVPYFFEKLHRYLCQQGLDQQVGSLRTLLGGRIRLCCSGGAALPVHLFDFFVQQGVTLLQGYGLTETSPVITASTVQRNRRGSSGPPIPGVEVRIADDGEILTRGPHVMLGYFNNQTATDEVLQDGWFHTGDIGRLDDDGMLRITGRKKELIVTSSGKNIAPVLLETLLTQDPLILQAMVIGDDRSYLTALIVPDPENLKAEIIARRIPVMSRAGALAHPKVLALYQERIAERLASLAPYEQVRKFKLLDRGFTIESGELTPKLSLRRQEIAANFAAQIDAMYQ